VDYYLGEKNFFYSKDENFINITWPVLRGKDGDYTV
jgi:hypothetical protein